GVAAPAASPGTTQGASQDQPTRRSRPGLGQRLVRRLRRRLTGRKPAPRRPLSPFGEAMREADADVVHFPRQTASATTVPNIYQPWDLQHLHLPEFFMADARQHRDAVYRAFCAQASLIVVATSWVKHDVAAQ